MKLIVTNNRSYAMMIESRYIQVAAGATVTLNNAGPEDIYALKGEADITVKVEYETGDLLVFTADVTVVQPAGGVNTAAVSFQLRDQHGYAVKEAVNLKFGAFDDVYCVAPAGTATLNTATKGTIRAGAGTAALIVTTDANGEFACTLTDAVDETVYLACQGCGYGLALVDGSEVVSAVFQA